MGNVYPRNDYSGLNSLRARLRNRHWDGKSPLANDSFANCSGIADPGTNDNTNSGSGPMDKLQLVNLDELTRVAKKYGLYVTVIGAVDAATGTAVINDALSASRDDYISTELVKRGLAAEHITKVGKGGISDYNPTEANRLTKVLLFMK